MAKRREGDGRRPGERRIPRRAQIATGRPRPAVDPDRIRRVVLELWTRTRMDWGFAATRLSYALKEERTLGSRARRTVVETLYGMIRQARRVDFALEAALPRLPAGARRELARYLAYRLLAGEITQADAARDLPEIDWQTVIEVDTRIAKERDPGIRFALTHSLPDWLAQRLMSELGDDADAFVRAINERAPLTLRVNTLKISRDALLERLRDEGIEAEPTTYAKSGVRLKERLDVWSLPAFKEGLFEAQDEGSQLIAELVMPPPRGLVADVCAGAGGKTLALGALMENKGQLKACDVDGKKLEDLKKRARRAGISSIQAMVSPSDQWPAELAQTRFDRVLADVPCSGIGSLRRNPELRWRLEETDLENLTREQESLATRALELVAPGGRLIYATCTVLRAENEDVVERLLKKTPGLELVRAAELWGNEFAKNITDPSGTFLKTAPHKHGTDGFFAAVLRKR